MPYPYSHLPATRAADYQSLMDYTSPQAPPMFSQGQGIPSYTPQTQAPTATGMDWGMSAPKFAWDGSALAAAVPSGLTPQMSWGDKLSSSDFWFGGKDDKGMQTTGAAGTAIGLANGLMSGYMGMKQYGLSKDILENNKSQFAQNFGMQEKLVKKQWDDRESRRAREAKANGSSYNAQAFA